MIPTPSPPPTITPSPRPLPPSPSPTGAPAPASPAPADLAREFAGRRPTTFGLDVPGVLRRTPAEAVSLTFDACGGRRGSDVDEALLRSLEEAAVPATLFLNARWIDANEARARELAATGLFELANHGLRHRPLTVNGREAYGIAGTRSVREVVDEVQAGRRRVAEITGVEPRWFRAGTAHVDDVAVQVCARLQVTVVNFDVNADAGATYSSAQVRQALRPAGPGSIVIGHMNRPGSGTAAGVRDAIARMSDRGVRFTTLSAAMGI